LLTAEEEQGLLRNALLAGATDMLNKKHIQLFENYLQRFVEMITPW